MDKLIQVLFNPNHEMPNGYVLVVLVALCLIVPAVARYIQQKRALKEEERSAPSPESGGESEQAPKKKKS